jgi:hypothetical protein
MMCGVEEFGLMGGAIAVGCVSYMQRAMDMRLEFTFRWQVISEFCDSGSFHLMSFTTLSGVACSQVRTRLVTFHVEAH